jgi:osmotically-inducible protein OsmY
LRRRYPGRYEQDDYDTQPDAAFYGYSRYEGTFANMDPDVALRREGEYRSGEYGSQPHFGYGRSGQRYQSRDQEEADRRGWWDKTTDEVASWFGDEQAAQRRRLDAARAGNHRGRGPKNYVRSDSRIEEDINDRLTDHDYLDAYDIDVKVNNCEVVLTGNVPDRYSKFLAEEISQQVSGVRNVENRLRIDRDKTAPLTVEPASLEAKEVTTGKAATTKNI